MQSKKLALIALMLMLAGGTVLAASSTSSTVVLQVTDYSTVPSQVYPGTSGFVKLTVTNTGTDTASGVTVYYTHSQSSSPLFFSAGDISAASSEQLTIPFKVPQVVATGIYLVNVDIYYTPASTSGQKKTSISIPLIVSQYEALEVTTLGSSRSVIAPGDVVQLQLAVNNTGGVVNNLIVTTPQNSSFSIEGTTQDTIGNIPSGSGINATVNLVSSSTASIGQYTIPLVFTYQDAGGNTLSETLYVGPISILESSTQFRLRINPLTPTEVGSTATLQLTLENVGSSPLTAIVDVNSTSVFTPLSVSRVYFNSIAPGQNASQNITIGISNSVSSGYYNLPFAVTLSSGATTAQNVGIVVSATPDLVITASQSSSTSGGETVTIQISNTGNTPIRSVYVTADSKDFTISGTPDRFIGTLNVDDFATLPLTVIPRAGGGSNRTIDLTISFKDSNNIAHEITKSIDVGSSSAGTAFSSTSTFAGGRRSQGVIFGLDWTQIIGGLVIIVVACLAYLRFRKKKVVKA